MFVPEDYVIDDVEVWPENWAAFRIFFDMQTQWRVGMGGATGLDYPVLFTLLDRRCVDQADWDELFGDIQHMEKAALKQMHTKV